MAEYVAIGIICLIVAGIYFLFYEHIIMPSLASAYRVELLKLRNKLYTLDRGDDTNSQAAIADLIAVINWSMKILPLLDFSFVLYAKRSYKEDKRIKNLADKYQQKMAVHDSKVIEKIEKRHGIIVLRFILMNSFGGIFFPLIWLAKLLGLSRKFRQRRDNFFLKYLDYVKRDNISAQWEDKRKPVYT